MVVRNVYTPEEEKMLARWREKTDKLVGWLGEEFTEQVHHPVVNRVAARELITRMAYAADYKNPLWRDEAYARTTRWGGLIAPPFFEMCISLGGIDVNLEVPPEVGDFRPLFGGDYWEFFAPIRVNDSFRVWIGRPGLQDVSPPDGEGWRQFRINTEVSYVNQRDEITGILRRILFVTIMPLGWKKGDLQLEFAQEPVKFTEEYVYTKDEIAGIDRAFAAEERRAATPRYWEDVEVGELLEPVVWGPITTYDQMVDMQATSIAVLPTMQMRSVVPNSHFPVDPKTNIPHMPFEFHLTEPAARAMGWYSTTIVSTSVERFGGRLITNWMGDDGFLRRFDYFKLANTPLGDTLVGRGRVAAKYVDGAGNHMVELDLWMESIRGFVSNAIGATVCLLSREAPTVAACIFTKSEELKAAGRPVTIPSRDAAGLSCGDRVAVEERDDWFLSGSYRLAGATGTVHEVITEQPGYVTALLDGELTGIDRHIPLGFRADSLRRI